MTTTIGRNKGKRIEWTPEEKDLLYYVCTSPTLEGKLWSERWKIFDAVRLHKHRPERSLNALTSTWKRIQKDLKSEVPLPDPLWKDTNWWQDMAKLVETAITHSNLSYTTLPSREDGDMIIDAGAGVYTGTETAGVLEDSMFDFDDLNSV